IPVRVLVEPERFETEIIPAVFETVQRERVVPRTQWEEVLCDTNATRTKVAEIQRALTQAGYFTAADGVFGPKTLAAMEAYQRDKALPVGYMTVETVRSLGVNPYA
ncbi:MAG: peptidoglycan-binding domain-containing protein, partial [Pseudomonadota bacterium]